MPEQSDTEDLRRAVEGLHGGKATFERFERVTERHGGDIAWEGDVAIFALADNPTAKRCYAWSEPITGGKKVRFYAVLHEGGVTSPTRAVQASILHDTRGS